MVVVAKVLPACRPTPREPPCLFLVEALGCCRTRALHRTAGEPAQLVRGLSSRPHCSHKAFAKRPASLRNGLAALAANSAGRAHRHVNQLAYAAPQLLCMAVLASNGGKVVYQPGNFAVRHGDTSNTKGPRTPALNRSAVRSAVVNRSRGSPVVQAREPSAYASPQPQASKPSARSPT